MSFKQLVFLFLLAFLGLYSCSNDNSYEPELNTSQVSESQVDPKTPQGVGPTFNNSLIKAPQGVSGNFNLIWSDEFGGSLLNTSKWSKSISTKSRNPRPNLGVSDWWWVEDHAYLNGNGQLILEGSKVDSNTMYCGAVESRNIFEPQYGYIEVRMEVAETSKGNHTAFWFQGHNQGNVDGTGNDGAEVDVFESAWTGDYTKSVVHIDGYGADHQANTKRWDANNLHNGYHTFGILWTPSKMEIFYDGVKTTEYNGIWVPNVQEWIWLSVGASFGDGDFQSQPIGLLSNAKVDYVRVWDFELESDPQNNFFRLTNKETGKWIKTFGDTENSLIKQSDPLSTGNWTTWKTSDAGNGYFYFINEGTQYYFRPQNNVDGSNLQLKPTSFSGAWTQWEMINAGDGYYYIRNRETGKYIRPSSPSNGAEIILTSGANSDWEKWYFDFVN